jgi:hypothetical protein
MLTFVIGGEDEEKEADEDVGAPRSKQIFLSP